MTTPVRWWDKLVVIAGMITVWDQVLVMVVIAGKITVWFWSRGDRDGILLGRLAKRDMVMEIWDGDLSVLYQSHTMFSSCFIIIVVNLINLLNAMLLSCLDVYDCCELASTFNVLTWRVMPDCRWCHDFLLACRGCRSCELDRVPARVPAEWSSPPSSSFRC